MEKTVGPVSTCGRELLRGWWWTIGLMASFMIFYSVSPEYFGHILVQGSLWTSVCPYNQDMNSSVFLNERNYFHFNIISNA
jgi:hypothetical protein